MAKIDFNSVKTLFYARKLRKKRYKEREIAEIMQLNSRLDAHRLLRKPIVIPLNDAYAFDLLLRIEGGEELSERDKHVLSVVKLPSVFQLKETEAGMRKIYSYEELPPDAKERAYYRERDRLAAGGFSDAATVTRILDKLGRVFNEEGLRSDLGEF